MNDKIETSEKVYVIANEVKQSPEFKIKSRRLLRCRSQRQFIFDFFRDFKITFGMNIICIVIAAVMFSRCSTSTTTRANVPTLQTSDRTVFSDESLEDDVNSYIGNAIGVHTDLESATLIASNNALSNLAKSIRTNLLSLVEKVDITFSDAKDDLSYFKKTLIETADVALPSTVVPVANKTWQDENGKYHVQMTVAIEKQEYVKFYLASRNFKTPQETYIELTKILQSK